MTRRAFLKKYAVRFAAVLLPCALIVYTIYHVFSSSGAGLMTAAVRRITDYQTVSGQAYLFREEAVLTVPETGLVENTAISGAKVARGGELVRVYHTDASVSEENRAMAQRALDDINRRLAILSASELRKDATLSQADGYRAEAVRAYTSIRQTLTGGGQWTELGKTADDMLAALNRYEVLTGKHESYSALAEELKSKREALLPDTYTTIANTESSGYFYSRELVDGYETIFTPDALEALTAGGLDALAASEPVFPEEFSAGKLMYGNRWRLAMTLDPAAAETLEVDAAYTFSFPANKGVELKLICERLTPDADGRVLAVFASDEVPPAFVYLRRQAVEITTGMTAGYYVPDAAMRVVDGVEGVYIFEIGTVYFRRVEVLLRGDGYCIVAEQGDRGAEYLALNDMMITSGEVLYDGRVMDE